MNIFQRLKIYLISCGYHPRQLLMTAWLPTLLQNVRRGGLRVLVFKKTKISIRGSLEIDKKSILYLNMPNFFASSENGSLIIGKGAKLIVKGRFAIVSGAFIDIKDGARLELMGNSYFNRCLHLECRELIVIGANTAIGPNVFIQDCDGHDICGSKKSVQPVIIGNGVWIGAGAKILKGVNIGDGCVVAAGAVVTKSFPNNCLIAGVPATAIKTNISWK